MSQRKIVDALEFALGIATDLNVIYYIAITMTIVIAVKCNFVNYSSSADLFTFSQFTL